MGVVSSEAAVGTGTCTVTEAMTWLATDDGTVASSATGSVGSPRALDRQRYGDSGPVKSMVESTAYADGNSRNVPPTTVPMTSLSKAGRQFRYGAEDEWSTTAAESATVQLLRLLLPRRQHP